jgi:dTDP-4-amino-4,6-dideoxygalactose transaminase
LKAIPFFSFEYQHQQVRDEAQQRIMSVYDSGWFISGKELAAFESDFAQYSGVKHAVGVGNGLDALTLCLIANKIGPNDEVIVPSHTYIATWLAITRVGAIPIPIEPDPFTFNIDVNKVEEKITARTRAILPVHLYGQACNMTAIQRIAKDHKLKIIEDNAQAVGSHWLGKATGSWGEVNATSFYPTKNLGALGDGGAVTTDDTDVAEHCRQLSNYGFQHKNVAAHLGLNSRLDEMQAAVLRVKLSFVNEWIESKRKLASIYLDLLKGIPGLELPIADPSSLHTYHLFVIRTSRRDSLQTYLHERGIETQIHYPIPPHLQKPYHYLNYKMGTFQITEEVAASVLSLPLWVGMTPEQIEYVANTIRKALT